MSITIEVLKPEQICAKEKPPTGETRRQYFRVRATASSSTPEDFHLSVSQSMTPDSLPTGWTAHGMPSATTISNATPDADRTWEIYIELADTATEGEYSPTFGNKYGLSGEDTFDETDGATAYKTFQVVEYLSGRDTVRVTDVKRLAVIDGQAVEVLDWYELAGPAPLPPAGPSGAIMLPATPDTSAGSAVVTSETSFVGAYVSVGLYGQYMFFCNGTLTLSDADNPAIQTVVTVWVERSGPVRHIIETLRLYPSEVGAFSGAVLVTLPAEGSHANLGITVSQSCTIAHDVQISKLRVGYTLTLT